MSFSQHDYELGFKDGYIYTYRRVKNTSFDPFVPFCPFAPFRQFNDNRTSYQAGWERGAEEAIKQC
jgi:hypothetical protein